MPRVSTVTGSERICRIGLMDMLMSDRMSAKNAMPTQDALLLKISMPGTSHTAAEAERQSCAEERQKTRCGEHG